MYAIRSYYGSQADGEETGGEGARDRELGRRTGDGGRVYQGLWAA